jgi:glycosyltransferase involved in cell wall biosynthesis
MRVFYLIDSLVGGGAEQSLAALAPHYRALGIDLDVAYLHERDGVRGALEGAGARVYPPSRGEHLPGAVRRARQLLRARRPDVVHTTLYEADVAGRIAGALARVPVVTSLVNTNYGPEHFANPGIAAWRLRAAQLVDVATARRVVRFHAVSSSVADDMAPRLHVPRERIDVVPRGREPGALGTRTFGRRDAARAALGIARDEPLVVAVGRQEHQKGFDVLLDAFVTVRRAKPAARLVVAGREGNATHALRTDAPGVEFLGHRDDVADLLCAADVFAFPSRWEGMPGGVIEAMALEAPIVASDIVPVREVLGDPAPARLVPPDDAAQLAAAILATIDDPQANERAAAARARFLERFTIERVAAEMLRFYERALA